MSDAAEQIWAAMRAVYAGFLAGDPAAVDRHLAPAVTIWDSSEVELVLGLSALAELRSRRPPPGPGGPAVVDLVATDPLVDVWGETALLRHRVRVVFAGDRPDELVRNTSVWRLVQGQWIAVHNHEDVLASEVPGLRRP